MGRVFNANPYLKKDRKTITYNVIKTTDGWKIEAVIPARVSPSDRLSVLEWFKNYRRAVVEKHPNWTTMFHPNASRYTLEVRSTNSDKEVIAAGEDLRAVCGEMMEYV